MILVPKTKVELMGNDKLPVDSPVVVFDVHGTLLEPTWMDEIKETILKFQTFDERELEEWTRKNIPGKSRIDTLKTFSTHAGVDFQDVLNAHNRVKIEFRKESILKPIEIMFRWVRILFDKGIPIYCVSSSEENLLIKHLIDSGFSRFFPEKNVYGLSKKMEVDISGDEQEIYLFKKKCLVEIQSLHKNSILIGLDDWIAGLKAIKSVEGISIAIPQGEGEEFSKNKEKIMDEAQPDYVILDMDSSFDFIHRLLPNKK